MIEPKTRIISVTDIMFVFGLKERTAYRLMHRVRKHFNKPKRSFVTPEELCKYTGLDLDQMRKHLG